MENMHFGEVSGDASWPSDYTEQPKNNQKGPVFNPGILVTVEEDMVGFQVHRSQHNLEGSGAVEVPGLFSDNGPRTTLRKFPMFLG